MYVKRVLVFSYSYRGVGVLRDRDKFSSYVLAAVRAQEGIRFCGPLYRYY